MNEYPPAKYISEAMAALPAPVPGVLIRIVDIDARPFWGLYRVTFVAKVYPGDGRSHYCFWALDSGKRIAGVSRSRLSVEATTCSASLTPAPAIHERHPATATCKQSWLMTSRPPHDGRPPSNYLAAAIKRLPTPGPDVPPQRVVISVQRSGNGKYEVTFIARRNLKLKAPSWFWGIQSSRRLLPG